MTTIAQKIRFAEAQITVPDGNQFRTDGYEWLIDNFWKPLDGYHVWPANPERLCDECRLEAGGVTLDFWSVERTQTKTHKRKKCDGLEAVPFWLILLELPRQSGKTTGTSGYVLPTIFGDRDESIAFIAGSEDQAEQLFNQNYANPVRRNKTLQRRSKVVGNKIKVPKMQSEFEFLPTSLAGTTGGTRTKVIMDEARAIPAAVAVPLMPQIFARNGWRCPTRANGHTKTNGDLDDPTMLGKKCTACGERLIPWTGQVVATSSASVLDGGDKDWFHESCTEAERAPSPGVHVYRATGVINPKVSKKQVNRIAEFFGRVETTADLIEVEANNVSRRRGEPFITSSQLSAVVDDNLRNYTAGAGPCVGFLDTSISQELTSLVILGAEGALDPEGEDEGEDGLGEWSTVGQWRLDVWDPKDQPGGMIGVETVLSHLETWIPIFKPSILAVDTRAMKWAKDLVAICKRKPWGRGVVTGVDNWGPAVRDQSWQAFEERILSRRIRLQNHKIQNKELRAARRVVNVNNRVEIRERSRKKRHLDIAESVAGCVYLIDFQAARKSLSLADVRRVQNEVSASSVIKNLRKRTRGRGFRPGTFNPNKY